MDKYEMMERDKFNRWFKSMLNKCDSCFERDVLRENKEAMWATWLREAIAFDENQKQNGAA